MNLLQWEKALYIIMFVYNKLRASERADEMQSCYLIFASLLFGNAEFWELIIWSTLLKIKVLHDDIRTFNIWKTFLFDKRFFVVKEGSSDYKKGKEEMVL